VNGRVLHFYLAGINNQNFLMRDKETGTWWQQINGKAVYGPLQGASLDLVPYDELTFGEWKSEVSGGQVFAPIAKFKKEYDPNWEAGIQKLPVVITFPGTEFQSRDVVVGVEVEGASRCYRWDTVLKQSPIMDHVGGKPVMIAVAPDGKSFRAFLSQIDGKEAEFFLQGETENETAQSLTAGTKSSNGSGSDQNPASGSSATPPPVAPAASPATAQQNPPSVAATTAGAGSVKAGDLAPKPWVLLDTTTASEWNFQGCAISGPAQGKCLDRIPILKDYWFDWRNYHPETTVYKH
jgi:hypothetical protein